MKKRVYSAFFFLFISLSSYAEDFRISKLHLVNISESSDFSSSITMGINDGIAINLPDKMEYLDGIELRFEIPEEIALLKSCCEFSIYDSLSPSAKIGQIDYSGNKIFRGVVPSKLSWIIQIPFSKENNLKSNQYTTKIGQIPDLTDKNFLIRLHSLINPSPSEIADSKINVTIKPIFSNKGKLYLNLKCPDENMESCTIYIDDYAYNMNTLNKGIFLDSGIHNISVISEFYRTEVRKIRIDQTKETMVSIVMKSIEPTVLVTAPGNIKIYIDDELCHSIGKEFIISEGNHIIKFSLGDYEVIRSLNVIKGKSYKINISVDLQVHEE